MAVFDDFSFDLLIMGDRPCIRGMRVTVGMIVGMIATNHSIEEVLHLFPIWNVKTSCRLSVTRRGGARREKLFFRSGDAVAPRLLPGFSARKMARRKST
jgi:Protein of unknown function (DUF433)